MKINIITSGVAGAERAAVNIATQNHIRYSGYSWANKAMRQHGNTDPNIVTVTTGNWRKPLEKMTDCADAIIYFIDDIDNRHVGKMDVIHKRALDIIEHEIREIQQDYIVIDNANTANINTAVARSFADAIRTTKTYQQSRGNNPDHAVLNIMICGIKPETAKKCGVDIEQVVSDALQYAIDVNKR